MINSKTVLGVDSKEAIGKLDKLENTCCSLHLDVFNVSLSSVFPENWWLPVFNL